MRPVNEGFSEGTRVALERAGWFPGRRGETDKYCELLRRDGVEPYEVVKDFLAEFGGLRLETPPGTPDEHQEWFFFGVVEPSFHLMQFYSRAVGEYLFKVGLAYRGYMVLGMGSTGAVYAGYDETLIRVGESGVAAIECLWQGGATEEIEIATSIRKFLPGQLIWQK